jgi:hypothetical protein
MSALEGIAVVLKALRRDGEVETFCIIYESGVTVEFAATVPKFAGSNPAEAVGYFGRKSPQHAFPRRGIIAVCSMSQLCRR